MTHTGRCAGAGLGPRPRTRPDSVAARLVLPFDSLVPLSLEPREEAGSAVSAMLFRCAGGGESSTAGSCGGLTEIAPLIGRQGRVFHCRDAFCTCRWLDDVAHGIAPFCGGRNVAPTDLPQTAGSCRDASAGLGGHGLRDMRLQFGWVGRTVTTIVRREGLRVVRCGNLQRWHLSPPHA